MSFDAKWSVNVDAEKLQAQVREQVFAKTKETFDLDILPEAQRLSPVSETWPSIPQSRGEKRIDTGHNRGLLATETTQEANGTKATLYGQSGYSGYLETGTARMPARPYMFPAWMKFKSKLTERYREIFTKGKA
jgi:HK97 gp10 family phage protein